MKTVILLITLATQPVTAWEREVTADYCEQTVRDFYGARAMGKHFVAEIENEPPATIEAVQCRDLRSATAERPTS